MKKIIQNFEKFPTGSFAYGNREIKSDEDMEQFIKELEQKLKQNDETKMEI